MHHLGYFIFVFMFSTIALAYLTDPALPADLAVKKTKQCHTITLCRSAVTGNFVPLAQCTANPRETILHRIRRCPR